MSHTTSKQFDKWFDELSAEEVFKFVSDYIATGAGGGYSRFIEWIEENKFKEGE